MSKLPAVFSQQLPDFVQQDGKMGNENITADDLQLPRLKVLQALSPELDESKSAYIEGAKAGQIVNSVTHETMASVNVINLYYKRSFNVWLKRELGGGLVGSFDSEMAARTHLEDAGLDPASHDIVETATHYLLTLNEDGTKITGQAVIDMISSNLAVSSNWNSRITMTEAPRFAGVWKLATKRRSNAKGSWHVFEVDLKGFVSDQATYEQVKSQYENLAGKAA